METTFIYGLFDPRNLELRYIGKSDDPKSRLRQHVQEAKDGVKTHRHNWINQLLSEGLTPSFEILEEVPRDNWQEYEKEWIKECKEKGLNLINATDGGEGTQLFGDSNPMYGLKGIDSPKYGSKRTLEQKVRMSAAQKKHWDDNPERKVEFSKNNPSYTQEFKDGMSGDNNPAKRLEVGKKISKAVSGKNNGMYGKKHTAESKKKLSESLLKFNRGLEVHFNKGRKLSEEHKRKIGEAGKGRVVSEETREKLRVINEGKVVSEETREKLRKVNIGKELSEETKQKISKAGKGRKLSEETKRKMSEAKKLWWAKRKKILN